jgi:4-amino-4-deoxy-L-arabinose transferase-like glycosyltransferase
MSERKFILLTVLVTLFGFAVRAVWLQSQPVSYDDFGVGLSALNYVESGQLGPTMWNHPVLRNILVYCSLKVFGSGVIGLKGWSVLFGTLSVTLMSLVSRRILKSREAALMAALLWALDPLAIDFSRQAINDIYLVFFPLAAIYLAYKYYDSRNPWFLPASGIFFGLGLASKWSAVFQLLATGVLLLSSFFRHDIKNPGAFAGKTVFLFASLILVPLMVYLLTFIPWFGRGYALKEWPQLQRSMYIETTTHNGYTPERVLPENIGDHKAYEWFIRPVSHRDIFYIAVTEGEARQEPTLEDNIVMFLAIGNPLVWLLVIPAILFALYRGMRRRDEGLLYLSGLFLISYLPMVVARRPIWVNSALIVIPYAIMAVAYLVWKIFPAGCGRRRFIAGYLAAVCIMTVPLFVFAIGKGFKVPYLKQYLFENYYPRKAVSLMNEARPAEK